jgi:7-keto-8-aminopelargonate synthetase-like enzyme
MHLLINVKDTFEMPWQQVMFIADFYTNPEILAPLSTSDHNIVLWKSRTDASVVMAGNIVRVKVRVVNHTNTEPFGCFFREL